MCVAWHTCLKHSLTLTHTLSLTHTHTLSLSQTHTHTHTHSLSHTHTHTQHHVQHTSDVHINTASFIAHICYRHTYLQSILPPSFKCKSDQTLSIFPISHIHKAPMTQCLYSCNQTKRGEVWNVHIKGGCRSVLSSSQICVCSWGEDCSITVHELCCRWESESELYKQGYFQTLDMSFKEGKHGLYLFKKNTFLISFVFPNFMAVILSNLRVCSADFGLHSVFLSFIFYIEWTIHFSKRW